MKRKILVVFAHPEYGRTVRPERPNITSAVLHNVYVPDDSHPLGGRCGEVRLYRRVNLVKDEVPRWFTPGNRPLYEFVQKERMS